MATSETGWIFEVPVHKTDGKVARQIEWDKLPESIQRELAFYGTKQKLNDYVSDFKATLIAEIDAAIAELLTMFSVGIWAKKRASTTLTSWVPYARAYLYNCGVARKETNKVRTEEDVKRVAGAAGLDVADVMRRAVYMATQAKEAMSADFELPKESKAILRKS